MSGHTPGPWRSLGADTFGDHTIARHDGGLAIASVVANFREQEEVDANTHLIAAAPELLQVCKDIAQGDSRKDAELWWGIIEAARKVVAKAEGRE